MSRNGDQKKGYRKKFKKDAKKDEKKDGKRGQHFISFFHQNNLFAQCRIEKPSVITGGLKI